MHKKRTFKDCGQVFNRIDAFALSDRNIADKLVITTLIAATTIN